MIRKQSDDPNIEAAAEQALRDVEAVLKQLPKAEEFDYNGHTMRLGEYDVCVRCTTSIAEAQQASWKLHEQAEMTKDPLVKEHIELAAGLLRLEASAAEVRAELHNGQGSEKILNQLLGFIYDRNIHDSYDHNHDKEN